MRFKILGPLEISDALGAPIDLKGAKTRALLGLLLLNTGAVVSSDELIDRLWESDAPHDALGTLQVHVSRLRKSFVDAGDDIKLISRKPGYLLELDPNDLDASVFDDRVAEARAKATAGMHAAAAAELADALALWRGPVLSDVSFAGPPIGEIARLEGARREAVEDWADAELAGGHHREIASRLESLLTQYPLSERLWAARMLALYRSDRQSDALHAFQELRTLLAEELGIDPSPSVRQLHEAILRQEPALAWGPSGGARGVAPERALPAGLATAETTTFVGREPELSWLHGLWDGALKGDRRLGLLSGEAGIGKTKLAGRFAVQVFGEGATVLWGRCDEDAIVPYQPFVEAIRPHLLGASIEWIRSKVGERRIAELARLVPEVRERFPDLSEPSPGEAETQRYRLFEAVSLLLLEISADAPLLLVLDDVHWADRSTLLLLRHLIRQSNPARILLLACYRDTEATPGGPLGDLLADLRRERIGERLHVDGFSFPEVADLCRSYVRRKDSLPTPAFVEALRQETQGNPFFIDEVLRHLEVGREGPKATPWGSTESIEQIELPESVRDVIGRRLSRLSQDARDLLAIASAVGAEFEVAVVEQLTDLTADRFMDALEEGLALSLLRDQRTSYAFSHALIRRALYDELSGIRKVRLHRRIGETIAALHAQDLDAHLAELAHHFFEAAPGGSWREAIEYTERAGAYAMKQLAYDEAARQYNGALEVLAETGEAEPRKRCELLVALGDAQWRAGHTIPARETFLLAADAARVLGDAELFAAAALGYGTGLGGYARTFRANPTLIALLEEALERHTTDSVLRVRLLARTAVELYFTPEVESRKRLAEEAVEMARRIEDPVSLLVALHCREWSGLGPDLTLNERLEAAEEIVRLAEELGEREVAYQGQFLRQMALLAGGQLDEADRAVETAERFAEELRMPGFMPWVQAYRAMRAWLAGRAAEAEALLKDAVEQASAQQSDPELTVAILGGQMIVYQLYREGYERLLPVIPAMVAEMPQHPIVRCCWALLATELGDVEETRAAFEPLAKDDFASIPRDANWFMSMWALAQSAVFLGDEQYLERLYSLLVPFADRWVTASVSICFGPVGGALGALAAALKRYDEAEAYLRSALAVTEELQMPLIRALTQRHYASMLLSRGSADDRKRAVAFADDVIAFGRDEAYPGLVTLGEGLKARAANEG